jgi:hypothetical protein
MYVPFARSTGTSHRAYVGNKQLNLNHRLFINSEISIHGGFPAPRKVSSLFASQPFDHRSICHDVHLQS